MKLKQKITLPRSLVVLVLGFGLLFLATTTQVSPVGAAQLTTWQKFIQKSCSGSTADAAEQCANRLTDKLKGKCGAPKHNDAYITCWRKFIIAHEGTAGPDSTPFEVEVAPELDGGTGCAGVDTAIIKCDADNSGDLEKNGVWALLLLVLNILTAGVGIVAVGGIVYGAILYTSAGDKAEQVKKAIGVITNVVIGVVAYFAMFALLQFIIPGGVFK